MRLSFQISLESESQEIFLSVALTNSRNYYIVKVILIFFHLVGRLDGRKYILGRRIKVASLQILVVGVMNQF